MIVILVQKNVLGLCRSASQLLMQMARREGVRSLWRGLDAALLLNLPLIAIYLPCYDYLESRCSAAGLDLYGPLLSGAPRALFNLGPSTVKHESHYCAVFTCVDTGSSSSTLWGVRQ